MQHDLQLRAAARAIYENVYPSEEWTLNGVRCQRSTWSKHNAVAQVGKKSPCQ